MRDLLIGFCHDFLPLNQLLLFYLSFHFFHHQLRLEFLYAEVLSSDLVELPKNLLALSCRWSSAANRPPILLVPSTKLDSRVMIPREEYRDDFDEVFLPTVKMTIVRFLLRVVATGNLGLLQLDDKTTFIHGDLDEEMYMDQPQGFVSQACFSTLKDPLQSQIGSMEVL